jgi:hypothetical protein
METIHNYPLSWVGITEFTTTTTKGCPESSERFCGILFLDIK